MAEAIDHKRLMSKKYMTWRVLQAPGAWSTLYRERARRQKNAPGMVVFPEQIMGGNDLYLVTQSRVGLSFGFHIELIHGATLRTNRGPPLRTLQDIYDHEFATKDDITDQFILNSSFSFGKADGNAFLFTGRNYAIRHMTRLANAHVR